MIKGWIEVVDKFQARGWAFDPGAAQRHVIVELALNGRPLATANANVFRHDLAKDGIGAGDHGFVFNLEEPLTEDELADLAVHAHDLSGAKFQLRRLSPAGETFEEPASTRTLIEFSGITSDPEQYPVCVLGAARSGTSAMAGALLKCERYVGYEEGHALDLLAHWSEQLQTFYNLKYDETLPGRNTMIGNVPRQFFHDALNNVFIGLARQLFGSGDWIDKTPNSDVIYLAPRFRQIWPNARFIFMRRRAIENLASRQRKFPQYDFARNCREWSDAMQAWLAVRDQLQGSAIEIDQMYLSRSPAAVAEQVRDFLGLNEVETRLLTQAFGLDRPQRTAVSVNEVLDLATIGWEAAWLEEFERTCQPLMDRFGYTTDVTYHRDGIEGGGMCIV